MGASDSPMNMFPYDRISLASKFIEVVERGGLKNSNPVDPFEFQHIYVAFTTSHVQTSSLNIHKTIPSNFYIITSSF